MNQVSMPVRKQPEWLASKPLQHAIQVQAQYEEFGFLGGAARTDDHRNNFMRIHPVARSVQTAPVPSSSG
jgi:hypothetical protein